MTEIATCYSNSDNCLEIVKKVKIDLFIEKWKDTDAIIHTMKQSPVILFFIVLGAIIVLSTLAKMGQKKKKYTNVDIVKFMIGISLIILPPISPLISAYLI